MDGDGTTEEEFPKWHRPPGVKKEQNHLVRAMDPGEALTKPGSSLLEREEGQGAARLTDMVDAENENQLERGTLIATL